MAEQFQVQDPTIIDDITSSIATTGHTPLVMTGVLLWFYRELFSRPDKLRETALKGRVWNSDPKLSKILVETTTRWDPAFLQQRPAVYIKRNDWQPQNNLWIANQFKTLNMVPRRKEDGSMEVFDSYGQYAIIIAGSHTVFCVAGTGAEAEVLGSEVFLQTLEFGPVLKKETNLLRLNIEAIGSVMKVEESNEHWAVPINIAYAFERSWDIKQEGPTLKAVSIDTK